MKMLAGLLAGVMAGGVGLGQGISSAGDATKRAAFADVAAMHAAVSQDQDESAGRRPMTFADLQRMKRLSDPQISSSSTWVMFSAVDVDLAANEDLICWVVPMAGDESGS
jgi:hypothetical protein